MSFFKTFASPFVSALLLALSVASVPSPAAAQRYDNGHCANEDGFCRFSGARYVRYGANDRYTVLLLKDGTDCGNAVFGDPTPNVRKACYVDDSFSPRRPCADEDGRCRFNGTRLVYFGANDRFTALR